MDEVFPVLAGIALGLVSHLLESTRLKVILIGALGIAFGACASWISGELAMSWTYVLIDTAQVVGAAVATLLLVRVWRRYRPARAAR
jgi:hypothetical protein